MALDISTVWCGPCNDASLFLSGGGSDPFSGMGNQIRDMINNGSIKWVTLLTQNAGGAPASAADGAAWDQQYPNENIPVLTEGDVATGVESGLQVGCFPSVYVVDEQMNFFGVEDCQTWNQLQAMVAQWG
jgi:hypothetical protein